MLWALTRWGTINNLLLLLPSVTKVRCGPVGSQISHDETACTPPMHPRVPRVPSAFNGCSLGGHFTGIRLGCIDGEVGLDAMEILYW